MLGPGSSLLRAGGSSCVMACGSTSRPAGPAGTRSQHAEGWKKERHSHMPWSLVPPRTYAPKHSRHMIPQARRHTLPLRPHMSATPPPSILHPTSISSPHQLKLPPPPPPCSPHHHGAARWQLAAAVHQPPRQRLPHPAHLCGRGRLLCVPGGGPSGGAASPGEQRGGLWAQHRLPQGGPG
jgi:hypothetical protein